MSGLGWYARKDLKDLIIIRNALVLICHAQQVQKLLHAHVHEIDPLALCVINRNFFL